MLVPLTAGVCTDSKDFQMVAQQTVCPEIQSYVVTLAQAHLIQRSNDTPMNATQQELFCRLSSRKVLLVLISLIALKLLQLAT